MANGAKTEDSVVLSKVRAGLKREFAFALKSHNEAVGSLGRTRARKNPNGSNEVEKLSPSSKRFKKSSSSSTSGVEEKRIQGVTSGTGKGVVEEGTGVEKFGAEDGSAGGGESKKGEKILGESEEELKSDVVDPTSDDENRGQSIESLKGEQNEGLLNVVAGDDEQKSDSGLKDLPPKGNTETLGSEVLIHKIEGNVLADQSATEIDEQERKNVVISTNGGEDGGVATNAPLAKKGLIKMIPNRLKDLLETGLLEGLAVRYVRGYRSKLPKEAGLRGVIKGCKMLCFCDECNGTNAVTPIQFELHAGSSNKRPVDYIYLENENSLRDVLNACKGSNLDDLEDAINNAIGRASERKIVYCLNCKGAIPEAGVGRTKLLCDSCIELKASHEARTPVIDASQRPEETAVQKSSASLKNSCSSGNKSNGKLTRKYLGLHKSALHDAVLPDGTEVGYYAHGKKLLSGYKKGSGIFCMCCQKEVSPSQFEAHAGMASRRKPYLHIYTSNGVSLHELSVSLNKSHLLSTAENDEVCSICGEQGHLLCCDGCPRVYHLECIQLSSIPEGSWYCRYCKNMYQREKYAERNANAIAAGRVAGVNPIEQIRSRCIRIVEAQDSDSGGCTLCRGHDFTKGGFGPRTVMICDQCEKEFHVGCLQNHGIQNLKELPEEAWFCCIQCNRIYCALQQSVQDGAQPLPDFVANVVKKKYAEKGLDNENLDIKWRLLSGKLSSVAEIRTLLAEAVSVFHDQFDPIVIPRTNQDVIPHMIYGRDVKDKYFGGMYCAVLTVNSVIVSAGVFRVFGNEVAELPLVATASSHQKLGHFEALFACIEKLLGDLDVKDMWLPAAREVKSFWIDKFGFLDFSINEFNERKKRYNVMTFDGTIMLRKDVAKPVNVEAQRAC